MARNLCRNNLFMHGHPACTSYIDARTFGRRRWRRRRRKFQTICSICRYRSFTPIHRQRRQLYSHYQVKESVYKESALNGHLHLHPLLRGHLRTFDRRRRRQRKFQIICSIYRYRSFIPREHQDVQRQRRQLYSDYHGKESVYKEPALNGHPACTSCSKRKSDYLLYLPLNIIYRSHDMN